jgi:DNA-binding response OmpR family regulator
MKRQILLVDDELAILLTLKAVLEISGFDVDTAASAREAKFKIKNGSYHMVITDMRMESESAGLEVVRAAKKASYRPAVAMLTAFPLADAEWQDEGADEMLVKPMHTEHLLQQIEALLVTHEDRKHPARMELEQTDASVLVAAAPARKRAAPRRLAAGRAR